MTRSKSAADATWEQVQYALDTVGSGDHFERLRDEAFRLHGVSEKAVKEHPEVNHEEAMKELWEIVAQDRETGRLKWRIRQTQAARLLRIQVAKS